MVSFSYDVVWNISQNVTNFKWKCFCRWQICHFYKKKFASWCQQVASLQVGVDKLRNKSARKQYANYKLFRTSVFPQFGPFQYNKYWLFLKERVIVVESSTLNRVIKHVSCYHQHKLIFLFRFLWQSSLLDVLHSAIRIVHSNASSTPRACNKSIISSLKSS